MKKSIHFFSSIPAKKIKNQPGNLLKLFMLLPICFLLAVSTSFATIRYVKAGGSGNGSTWAAASGGFQAMIDASSAGDQVWVAGGEYQPAAGASFSMKEGVKIYGGFPASGAPTITDRNFTLNITTLKGNGSTVVKNENNGLTNAALLDGFTVKGGNTSDFGAGIRNIGASPFLTNLIITGNHTSVHFGGVYDDNSSPSLTNVIINNNTADYEGGGIGNVNSSSPILTNVVIAGNYAGSYGGGMRNIGSSPILINVTISANTTGYSDEGGAMFNNAGGTADISNCILYGNSSGIIAADIYGNNIGTGDITVQYSLVQGIGADNNNHNPDGNTNPLFVDAPNGDFRLKSNSPVLNIGDNSANNTAIDLSGNPRKYGVIDLGAYEYQGQPCTPPSVTKNPNSVTVCAGDNTSFTTNYNGTTPVTGLFEYSTDNGNSYSNVTLASAVNSISYDNAGASISLTNIPAGYNGYMFRTKVSNGCGTVYSQPATLTVNPVTAINTKPAAANKCIGQPVSFSVEATGSNLHYQWRKGVTNITDANTATYNIATVGTNDAGNYSVVVSGDCGSVTSDDAPLTVNSPLTPLVTVANNCGSSVLSTTATGSLLWSTNETATSITVSTPGTYTVTQTVNGCTSDEGSANATPKAVPTTPEINVINNCGSSTLSTIAAGSLLWSTNETTSPITVSASGSYTVTVTNGSGCNNTSDATAVHIKALPAKPIISANGSTNFCKGANVTLSAPSGFTSYLWSNGSKNSSIIVNASGSYSVTVTNTDGCISPSSDPIMVTVGNDTQKPVVTPPPAVTLCYDAAESYAISPLQATDNCSIASTSYKITGATSRSGNGVNASGKFNPGTSTITWTVKDGNGNTSTGATKVVVNEKFIVAIPDSRAIGSGCEANTVYKGYTPASYIILAAKLNGGKAPYSIKWSNGASSPVIIVNPASATTYTVLVKDAKGCTQTAVKKIYVVDVRCGSKMDQVSLCYKGKALCIAAKDVAGYLLKGAYLGSCKTSHRSDVSEATEEQPIAESDLNTDNELGLSVKAYPNPSSSYFKLTVKSGNLKDKVNVSVTDELGRVVERRIAYPGQALEIGNSYHPGIYFVQAMQGNNSATVKLIRQSW